MPGPHFLACEQVGSSVRLSWDALGIDPELHAAILLRDKETLVELDPQALEHIDPAPAVGLRHYELQVVILESQQVLAARTCDIDVREDGGLECHVFGGIATPPQVLISWSFLAPGLGATAILVRRDGELAAELPADATEFSEEPLSGRHRYEVVAVTGQGEETIGACDLEYEPPVIGGFIRADVNVDELHDLSDAVSILLYLFGGQSHVTCLEAADTDDNGTVELTDAVFLLNFLFLGGAVPASPFPKCGYDPTDDELTCDQFGPCFTPPPP